MREALRRDGSVALYDENDDGDMVIIEPIVTAFTPVRGNARCVCGAPLAPWVTAAWQPTTSRSVAGGVTAFSVISASALEFTGSAP